MVFSVGIDLGTTNTVVSTARKGNYGGIEVVTEKLPQIGEDGRRLVYDTLLPSFLYVDGDEHKVGKVAKALKSQYKDKVIACSKNYIGERNHKWDIDGREYSPELVASYYLSAVRNYLKDKYDDEKSINNAVITVPASFDIDQRNATKTAAKLAGFDGDITLISEPTAAVLDFINEQSKLDDSAKYLDFSDYKNVLVFDLGGGTCDVAILKIKIVESKIYVEEITVSPHTLIGGTSFDAYAVEGLISDFEEENKLELSEILDSEQLRDLKAKLLMNLEDIKIYFSDKYKMKKGATKEKKNIEEEITLSVMEPGVIEGKPFKYKLSMKKYNEYIEKLLSRENKGANIIEPIDQTLKNCNMKSEDIDYIFAVGGMTRYPKVWEKVTEYFKKEPLKFVDSMESVSRGAAIYQHYDVQNIDALEKNNEIEKAIDVTITPKLPQSIFLNVKNGFPVTLIEANTKAGTPVIIKDKIKVTSEIAVTLELYAGRSVFDPELKKLESLKLDFPEAIKVGSDIVLKLVYTEKGVLQFNAWIKEKPEIEISISLEKSQLSNEEISEIKENYKILDVEGIR
ncbi:MAG: Hsp70 family protein [Sarcina sp.]